MTLYDFGLRFAAPFFRFILRVHSDGASQIPEAPLIVCTNHRSNADPIILGASFPRQICYMAKAELFKVPILGGLITALGAFPVNRGSGDGKSLDAASRVLKSGKVLGVFPEMHRNRAKTGLMRFHSGALRMADQTGVPLLPAAIIREKGIWPFRRIYMVFGSPVTAEELGYSKTDPKSRHEACARLREKVWHLMEENRQ